MSRIAASTLSITLNDLDIRSSNAWKPVSTTVTRSATITDHFLVEGGSFMDKSSERDYTKPELMACCGAGPSGW